MTDELNHERENGRYAAELLVAHLAVMGSEACRMVVSHDGREYSVKVRRLAHRTETHAVMTDGTTACGKRFIGAIPLRLEDVSCKNCRATVWYKAAVAQDKEGE